MASSSKEVDHSISGCAERPGECGDQSVETGSNKRKGVDSEPDLSTKVHSFNEWEKADLGDVGRKNKFLKLMGASKVAESSVDHVSPEKKLHSVDEAGERDRGLEDQFKEGLEHKLNSGRKGHIGLGFKDGSEPSASSTPSAEPQSGSTTSPKCDNGTSSNPDKSGKTIPEVPLAAPSTNKDAVKDNTQSQPSAAVGSSSTEQTNNKSTKSRLMMSFVKAKD